MSYGGYDQQGYAQNNYSGGGGNNAGGFVHQPSSQGGGGGGGGDRKMNSNTLRAVNIEQINNATQGHPDSDFRIDDVEVGQVTFVGRVVNISAASTNTTYKIEDPHGTIEVKQWVDPDKAGRENPIKNDMHVRVHGNLKTFSNRRHVGVVAIRPIEDDKEIQFHDLDVKATTLYFTKGPASGVGHAGNGNGHANGHDGYGNQNGMEGGGKKDDLASKLAVLDPFSRTVMEAIHSRMPAAGQDGVHIRIIQGLVNPGGNLRSTIEALCSEGHVYTTVDDDHIRSTMLNS